MSWVSPRFWSLMILSLCLVFWGMVASRAQEKKPTGGKAKGVSEAKKEVLANSKIDCSLIKDVTWEEMSGYKVKGNIKADPPLNVNFEYTVGKDGTLYCTGWKNLSSKNSLLVVTGSISNHKGDEIISFVDAHVSLRLDEKATNLNEKVFFEYCLTGKWRVRMFVQGNDYVTKVYRGK